MNAVPGSAVDAPRRVGLIGIGNMGFAMAARLLERGWDVAVRDVDARRERDAAALGAAARSSPSALAADRDVVIVAVVDAAQTESVLFGDDGAAPALAPGATVLLCPTIGPSDVERLGGRLSSIGLACVDAPMSGGPARARDGTMSLMIAAPDAVLARHAGLLDDLSSRQVRVGARLGDGARTKLVNNLLAGTNLVAAAEAMHLAERVGLDPARTLEVIEKSSGQSWVATDRMRRALAGDFAPRAHMTLLAKDTGLAIAMAREAGLSLQVGERAREAFAAACREGFAELDDAALLEHLRRLDRIV